jgi:hypothetical protein
MADNTLRVTRYLNNTRFTTSVLSDGTWYTFGFKKESNTSKIILHGVCPAFNNNNDGAYLYIEIDGVRKYTGVLENPNTSAGTDQATVIQQTWDGLQSGFKTVVFGWAAKDGGANAPWTITHPNSNDDARNPQTGSEWTIFEIETDSLSKMSATGGTTTLTSGNYKYHIFKASSNTTTTAFTFNVSSPGTVEYLVVAGGAAGGGGDVGAGGGAGGFRTNANGYMSGGGWYAEPALYMPSGSYTVTVGAGGVGVGSSTSKGGNGGNSSIVGNGINITSIGGGGGAGWSAGAANSGGSGGGGVTSAAGSGTEGQGFSGGTGLGGGNYPEGGGGGAGGPGLTSRDQSKAGNGGPGLPNPFQATQIGQLRNGLYYLAGGGGGGVESNAQVGDGGLGGGGQGGRQSSDTSCTQGQQDTGSGGGGEDPQAGCNGGSGIVIIRYLV